MAPITAVLGPTNTGKTHRAIEQMLQHESGMIGLPLRLLAREVYDRVTARVGEEACALVTGEEKRVPSRPRYWICTVEAMPLDRPVDFLAVDEIQLCGHRERGHVFTDRLLHARGLRETLLLGAETMRPLVERLVPGAIVEHQSRLSILTGIGSLPFGALPPRSAVVAFSAARVYELADRLRGRRGGAAVVLGALSPRARNAQVAMYQSGEVDYLVATDAIGMGLNLDVNCVAFAELRKFDGRHARPLDDAELAQIAGRAGRYRTDGQFATLAPLGPLPVSINRAIERHRFPPQERVYWRTHLVDTDSVAGLMSSLRRRPEPNLAPYLTMARADDCEDLRALNYLAGHPEVAPLAVGRDRVALLWQVCQVPDFRQLQLDNHFQLLAALYQQLTGPTGRLARGWIERHVAPLDDPHGDIDSLLARMAGIRTWRYVTNHAAWVDDAGVWQERTQRIEDDLSDALHAALVRRFVESRARRRARGPTRTSGDDRATNASGPTAPGKRPRSAPPSFAQLLRATIDVGQEPLAAGEEVDEWVDEWVEGLVAAPHRRFRLDEEGRVTDADHVPLARLIRGVDLLHPEVALTLPRELQAGARLRLHRRLLAWTRDLVGGLLALLDPAATADRHSSDHLAARTSAAVPLSPAARGLLYQLEQSLGAIPARGASEQLVALTSTDRQALRRRGVRVGRHVVFVPALGRPEAMRARVALANAFFAPSVRVTVPAPSAVSLPVTRENPDQLYAAVGYPAFGARAIRADFVDSVGTRLLGGAPANDVASRLGCSTDEIPAVRRAFAHRRG